MSLLRHSEHASPAEEHSQGEFRQDSSADQGFHFERIGDILRRERETRGDDLQWVADYLCIKRAYLEALENNDYDKLPADTYVVGFLRAYANYLGYEPQDVIDRYRNEMAGQRKRPALNIPSADVAARTPSGIVLIGAALAAMLIYALWYNFSAAHRATMTAPRTQSEVTEDAPTPVAVPDASATKGNAATPLHFSIHATQTSWILITDKKGKPLYDHVMKAGETYKVPDLDGLTLTTTNPNGIVLSTNGHDLPKLSANGATSVRSVALSAEGLNITP